MAKPAFPLPTGRPGEGNPEFRSAAALEFIAFYLDRIEGHLEQLANANAAVAHGMPRLVSEVNDVVRAIKAHK